MLCSHGLTQLEPYVGTVWWGSCALCYVAMGSPTPPWYDRHSVVGECCARVLLNYSYRPQMRLLVMLIVQQYLCSTSRFPNCVLFCQTFLSKLRLPGFLYKNMICLLILKWGGMQSLAHTLPDCLVAWCHLLCFLRMGVKGGGFRKRGPAVILHFMTRSVADRIRPTLWLLCV